MPPLKSRCIHCSKLFYRKDLDAHIIQCDPQAEPTLVHHESDLFDDPPIKPKKGGGRGKKASLDPNVNTNDETSITTPTAIPATTTRKRAPRKQSPAASTVDETDIRTTLPAERQDSNSHSKDITAIHIAKLKKPVPTATIKSTAGSIPFSTTIPPTKTYSMFLPQLNLCPFPPQSPPLSTFDSQDSELFEQQSSPLQTQTVQLFTTTLANPKVNTTTFDLKSGDDSGDTIFLHGQLRQNEPIIGGQDGQAAKKPNFVLKSQPSSQLFPTLDKFVNKSITAEPNQSDQDIVMTQYIQAKPIARRANTKSRTAISSPNTPITLDSDGDNNGELLATDKINNHISNLPPSVLNNRPIRSLKLLHTLDKKSEASSIPSAPPLASASTKFTTSTTATSNNIDHTSNGPFRQRYFPTTSRLTPLDTSQQPGLANDQPGQELSRGSSQHRGIVGLGMSSKLIFGRSGNITQRSMGSYNNDLDDEDLLPKYSQSDSDSSIEPSFKSITIPTYNSSNPIQQFPLSTQIAAIPACADDHELFSQDQQFPTTHQPHGSNSLTNESDLFSETDRACSQPNQSSSNSSIQRAQHITDHADRLLSDTEPDGDNCTHPTIRSCPATDAQAFTPDNSHRKRLTNLVQSGDASTLTTSNNNSKGKGSIFSKFEKKIPTLTSFGPITLPTDLHNNSISGNDCDATHDIGVKSRRKGSVGSLTKRCSASTKNRPTSRGDTTRACNYDSTVHPDEMKNYDDDDSDGHDDDGDDGHADDDDDDHSDDDDDDDESRLLLPQPRKLQTKKSSTKKPSTKKHLTKSLQNVNHHQAPGAKLAISAGSLLHSRFDGSIQSETDSNDSQIKSYLGELRVDFSGFKANSIPQPTRDMTEIHIDSQLAGVSTRKSCHDFDNDVAIKKKNNVLGVDGLHPVVDSVFSAEIVPPARSSRITHNNKRTKYAHKQVSGTMDHDNDQQQVSLSQIEPTKPVPFQTIPTKKPTTRRSTASLSATVLSISPSAQELAATTTAQLSELGPSSSRPRPNSLISGPNGSNPTDNLRITHTNHQILPPPLLQPVNFDHYVDSFYHYSTATTSIPSLSSHYHFADQQPNINQPISYYDPTSSFSIPHSPSIISKKSSASGRSKITKPDIQKQIDIAFQNVSVLAATTDSFIPRQVAIADANIDPSLRQTPLTSGLLMAYAAAHQDIIQRQTPMQIENIALLIAGSLIRSPTADAIGSTESTQASISSDESNDGSETSLLSNPHLVDVLLDTNLLDSLINQAPNRILPNLSTFYTALDSIRTHLSSPFLQTIENTLTTLSNHKLEHQKQLYQLNLRKKALELYIYKMYYQQYLLQQMASISQEYALIAQDMAKLRSQFTIGSLLTGKNDLSPVDPPSVRGGTKIMKETSSYNISFPTRLPAQGPISSPFRTTPLQDTTVDNLGSELPVLDDKNTVATCSPYVLQSAMLSTTIKTKPCKKEPVIGTTKRSRSRASISSPDSVPGSASGCIDTIESIETIIKFDPEPYFIKPDTPDSPSRVGNSSHLVHPGSNTIGLASSGSIDPLTNHSLAFHTEVGGVYAAIEEVDQLIAILRQPNMHSHHSTAVQTPATLAATTTTTATSPSHTFDYFLYSSLSSPPASQIHTNESFHTSSTDSTLVPIGNVTTNMDDFDKDNTIASPSILPCLLNADPDKLPLHLRNQLVSLPRERKNAHVELSSSNGSPRPTSTWCASTNLPFQDTDTSHESQFITPTYNNESIDAVLLSHLAQAPLSIIALLGLVLPFKPSNQQVTSQESLTNKTPVSTTVGPSDREHGSMAGPISPLVSASTQPPTTWFETFSKIIQDYKASPGFNIGPEPPSEKKAKQQPTLSTKLRMDLLASPFAASTYLFQNIIQASQLQHQSYLTNTANTANTANTTTTTTNTNTTAATTNNNTTTNTTNRNKILSTAPPLPQIDPPSTIQERQEGPLRLLNELFELTGISSKQFWGALSEQHTMLEGDIAILTRIKNHIFHYVKTYAPHHVALLIKQTLIDQDSPVEQPFPTLGGSDHSRTCAQQSTVITSTPTRKSITTVMVPPTIAQRSVQTTSTLYRGGATAKIFVDNMDGPDINFSDEYLSSCVTATTATNTTPIATKTAPIDLNSRIRVDGSSNNNDNNANNDNNGDNGNKSSNNNRNSVSFANNADTTVVGYQSRGPGKINREAIFMQNQSALNGKVPTRQQTFGDWASDLTRTQSITSIIPQENPGLPNPVPSDNFCGEENSDDWFGDGVDDTKPLCQIIESDRILIDQSNGQSNHNTNINQNMNTLHDLLPTIPSQQPTFLQSSSCNFNPLLPPTLHPPNPTTQTKAIAPLHQHHQPTQDVYDNNVHAIDDIFPLLEPLDDNSQIAHHLPNDELQTDLGTFDGFAENYSDQYDPQYDDYSNIYDGYLDNYGYSSHSQDNPSLDNHFDKCTETSSSDPVLPLPSVAAVATTTPRRPSKPIHTTPLRALTTPNRRRTQHNTGFGSTPTLASPSHHFDQENLTTTNHDHTNIELYPQKPQPQGLNSSFTSNILLHAPTQSQKDALKRLISIYDGFQLGWYMSIFGIAPSGDLLEDRASLYQYVLRMKLFFDTTSAPGDPTQVQIIVPGAYPPLTPNKRVHHNVPLRSNHVHDDVLSADEPLPGTTATMTDGPNSQHLNQRRFTRTIPREFGSMNDNDEHQRNTQGQVAGNALPLFSDDHFERSIADNHGAKLAARLNEVYTERAERRALQKSTDGRKDSRGGQIIPVAKNDTLPLKKTTSHSSSSKTPIQISHTGDNSGSSNDNDDNHHDELRQTIPTKPAANKPGKMTRLPSSLPSQSQTVQSKKLKNQIDSDFEDQIGQGDDLNLADSGYCDVSADKPRGQNGLPETGGVFDGVVFTYDDALDISEFVGDRIIREGLHLIPHQQASKHTPWIRTPAMATMTTDIPNTPNKIIENIEPDLVVQGHKNNSQDFAGLDIDTLLALGIDPTGIDVDKFNSDTSQKSKVKEGKVHQHSNPQVSPQALRITSAHPHHQPSHFDHTEVPLSTYPTPNTPLPTLSLCFDCLLSQWFNLPSQRLILHRISLQDALPQCNMYHLFDYYYNLHHSTLDIIVGKVADHILYTEGLVKHLLERVYQKVTNSKTNSKQSRLNQNADIPTTIDSRVDSLANIPIPPPPTDIILNFLTSIHQTKKEILFLLTKQCFNNLPLASSTQQWNKLRGLIVGLLLIIQQNVKEFQIAAPKGQSTESLPSSRRPLQSSPFEVIDTVRFIHCDMIPCQCFITRQFYSGLGISVDSSDLSEQHHLQSTLTTAPKHLMHHNSPVIPIPIHTVIEQISNVDEIGGHVIFFILAHLDLLIMKPSPLQPIMDSFAQSATDQNRPKDKKSSITIGGNEFGDDSDDDDDDDVFVFGSTKPTKFPPKPPQTDLRPPSAPLTFISLSSISKIYTMIQNMLSLLRYPLGLSKPRFAAYLHKHGLNYYTGYQNQ